MGGKESKKISFLIKIMTLSMREESTGRDTGIGRQLGVMWKPSAVESPAKTCGNGV